MADISPDQRDQLIELCGQHGAESIVLARRPGHVLWSDDFVTALLGQHSLGIRRTWTQAVLAGLGAQGFVTEREYQEASARLIGYGFISTRFDADTLLAAATLAQWAPGGRPVKQALEALSSGNDATGKLRIASMFISKILKEPIRQPGHGIVVMAVLDRIADGPCGIAGVEALRRNLSRLFGLDVAAVREAEQYINRWVAARELRGGIVH